MMRFSTGLTLAALLLGAEASSCVCLTVETTVTVDPEATSALVPSTLSTATRSVAAGVASDPGSSASAAIFATTSAAPAPAPPATTSAAPAAPATTKTRGRQTAKSTTAAAAATTTAASSGATSGLTTDQQNSLDAQNKARADVGEAALTWDAGLAAEAQAYAQQLVSIGSLVHSQTSGEGENLYWGSDKNPFLEAATLWIDEKSSYTPGEIISLSNYEGFGHYTQIVWKSTTHVGMGSATDSKGATYVVGRYSPPGNYLGEPAY